MLLSLSLGVVAVVLATYLLELPYRLLIWIVTGNASGCFGPWWMRVLIAIPVLLIAVLLNAARR